PPVKRDADRRDRQGLGEHPQRLLGSTDRSNRHSPAEPPSQRCEAIWVIDQVERRNASATPEPRLEGDLAANPGGLAHRHDERRHRLAQTLTSTKAVRRKSRR